jgi:hypothetical protein
MRHCGSAFPLERGSIHATIVRYVKSGISCGGFISHLDYSKNQAIFKISLYHI